ncbi:glycoside hydrolase family 15 protein [Salininema proteolyticum]|uniref:Glycoside hydrolase family 15 protein n=1 Tax=Salininema proteolyticum TaxID=1607685 RepID=A0ABV8TXE9_9ACTN
MSDLPIGDYAALSDRHSVALVSRDGSIDWFCRPAFDSPSLFGRLLDADAGHWTIAPDGPYTVERSYIEDTMALRTVFTCENGTVEVRDALLLGEHGDPRDMGREAPRALARIVECTAGEVDVRTVFKARPEYGMVHPILSVVPGGVTAVGGPLRMMVTSTADMEISHDGAIAAATLAEGQRLHFLSQAVTLADPEPRPWSAERIESAFADTIAAWRNWSDRHRQDLGRHTDIAHRSRLVLESLRYQPTGAIVAAPTTSLPEEIGGVRNWDYRYAWVRDASFTVQALADSGCYAEAGEFFRYLSQTAAHYHATHPLQIMFGIHGHHDLTERELDHLSGWRNSRPVRVGNAAWRQSQLDVYGELLDAAWRVRDAFTEPAPPMRRFLMQVAQAAADQWGDKDNGIWEARGEPRHYTYSKAMCWVALDRAVRLAPQLGLEEEAVGWAEQRDRVRAAVEDEGWNPRVGAFTASFGSEDLDASVLMLPLVGFLPGTDERIRSTVDLIADRLVDDRGLVRRYLTSGGDGLPGGEGSFLLCSFWLVQALTAVEEADRAEDLFDRVCSYANDVGLLSEEVDGATGELLGNFPQAFSHIGLINAASALHGHGRAD